MQNNETDQTDTVESSDKEETYEPEVLTPADSGNWFHDREKDIVIINPTQIDHRTVDADKFFENKN